MRALAVTKFTFLLAVLAGLLGLIALGAGTGGTGAGAGLITDEAAVQYPQGYTRLLVADLAALVTDEALRAGLFEPLAAAHHPLTGIYSALAMLQLDPTAAEYVAYGTGPGVSPLVLVRGLDPGAVTGALMGVRHAAGAPGSPFTHWDQEVISRVPVIFIGGAFGPMRIEWAYIVFGKTLWIVTEVGIGREPDLVRLRATVELVIARMRGKVDPFPEWLIAVAVRGGALAFVRVSDPAVDRPLEEGEQAMGYSVRFAEEGGEAKATVHFAVRFSAAKMASQAQERLAGGVSGYLAQDLYRGELVSSKRIGRELYFDVAAELPGIIGLVMLTIPM